MSPLDAMPVFPESYASLPFQRKSGPRGASVLWPSTKGPFSKGKDSSHSDHSLLHRPSPAIPSPGLSQPEAEAMEKVTCAPGNPVGSLEIYHKPENPAARGVGKR